MAKKTAERPPLVVKRVPLDDIKPDPRNPKNHTARGVKAIAASLRDHGQPEPLVVRKGTLALIGGHGRLEAMRSLGWTHADVTEYDGTDAQCAALQIRLNRTPELDGYDPDLLAEAIDLATSDPGIDLGSLGFSDDDMAELLAPEPTETDDAPTNHLTEDEPEDEPERPAGSVYPIAVTLTRSQYQAWKARKAEIKITSDTAAFLALVGLGD